MTPDVYTALALSSMGAPAGYALGMTITYVKDLAVSRKSPKPSPLRQQLAVLAQSIAA